MTFQERVDLEKDLVKRVCDALGRRLLDHQLGAEPSGPLGLEDIVQTEARAVLDQHIGPPEPPP